MTRGDWAVLGIDPTIDKAAIRRAYATKLKAMDVDADPDGFARLRAARDAALAGADAGMVLADEDRDEDDWIDSADWLEDIDVARANPEPPVPDTDDGPSAAIDAHYRALVELLFADDAPPTVPELDAIAHHGRALLDDPRLEQVDFAASAERWFADNLASAVPRSDPLLEPAAAAFGWIDRRDDYTLLPAAREVVERIGATRYVALLSDPSHRLHRAWHDLTHADGRKLRGRGDVAEVLTTVRTRYPIAEHWMEPERVAQWDAAAVERTSPGKITVWAIIAVVVILRLLLSGGSEPAPAPVVIPIASPAAVPGDPRLEPATGIGTGREPLVSGLTHAPDATIRDIVAWETKVMRYYQPFDPARCVDTSLWLPDARLSASWRDQQTSLMTSVLEHAGSSIPPRPSRTFLLSEHIVQEIANRTGMSGKRLARALNGDAEVKDVCAARVALYEAAMASPRASGNALIRRMQLAPLAEAPGSTGK